MSLSQRFPVPATREMQIARAHQEEPSCIKNELYYRCNMDFDQR